jgi:ribonuclease D
MSSYKKGQGGIGPGIRHFRRQESHQQSHFEQGEGPLPPVAAHPLVCPDAPTVVDTAAALAEMNEHLSATGSFAFDSEFIGEMSYIPRLCLVQAATTKRVFIVDPLAGVDLGSFWELVVSPAIEKVVLAGQQDFGPAVQHTGRAPAHITDVQIAAGFIHVDWPLSLSRLVQEFVGVALGKGLTFTRWDDRPLSAVQMRYAADDVRYLPAAWAVIAARVAELGRGAWVREECASALEDLAFYRPAPETLYLRVRGRDRLNRRALAVLRELAILRDDAARREKVPPRTLLNDGVLGALARRPVTSLAGLDAVRGLPRPVEALYGREIVEATERAMALPEDRLPPREPADTHDAQDRVDKLWADLTAFCTAKSVAPAMVASRKEVARLCRAAAAGQPLEGNRLGRGWRKDLLGDLLKQIL